MNKITVSTFALSTVFALTLVLGQADAMTIKDDSMMKKGDAMMSSTSDAMMKKDDAMSSTSDAMMKKDDVMMKAEDSMMKKEMGVMTPATADMSVGSRGEGVVALQTFLVAKNLLVIPAGVSMGYFGPLTKAALMSYQASVDVPSTGYYGPLTRAAMTAGMMMKADDSMMKKEEAMMKKDDAMMSSTTAAMMKKDDAMMKKSS